MSEAVVLGPLAVPVSLLLAFTALGLGWFLGTRIARRRGIDIEPPLWTVLAVGLLAARAAFVFRYREAYWPEPLSMVDIRDGGWSPLAGLAAAGACALLLAMRRAGLGKPLAAAMGTAVVVWIGGTLLAGPAAGPSNALPALTLTGLDGRPVSLQQFSGKPVVVNLWATWCPPCRREMPVLQEAQQRHPDVHFVFVNQGEGAAKVAGFLAFNGLQLRNVLLDGRGRTSAASGHRALPTTLFFDANGRLVDTRVGGLSAATLAQRLDPLRP